MELDEYQRGALRTAAPRDKRNELLHLVLGLVGESGEIAEKFKKWVRDLDSDESRIDRAGVAKELGDVLWYVAVLADYLDLSLDDIAAANLAKLASRQGRGVLGGSGDDRGAGRASAPGGPAVIRPGRRGTRRCGRWCRRVPGRWRSSRRSRSGRPA